MALEKFSSQADKKVLKDVKALAESSGRLFSSLVNEAFEDLLEKHNKTTPHKSVLEHFEASMAEYDELYRNLVK